jgi:hypothetical protein
MLESETSVDSRHRSALNSDVIMGGVPVRSGAGEQMVQESGYFRQRGSPTAGREFDFFLELSLRSIQPCDDA